MKIQGEFFRRITAVLGIGALILASGCAGTKKKEGEETPTAPSTEEMSLGDSDSGKANGLQTIHFPYDSFVLDPTGKEAAQQNATLLKSHPTMKVQIEGHCDQRGGIQYNIALGEKRANAVKKYMQGLGIGADRLTIISYGKEKPVDPGTSDEAYAKNRRANFVITTR